ncbi:unnamed protein product [Mesocestoides corti]|uniref:DUF862 domain-containing protein n=1 Tax=Mesocestoides corti TaxID=53468 RepID=A0A0R3U7A1_MESCO|nr:unnamed protein product [Mesocestoides corti]
MSDVFLYIYDLSMGMAKVLSESLVGRRFDGIWHTGVVVYGCEYFFDQSGISTCSPGSLQIGQLLERKLIGRTTKTYIELQAFVEIMSQSLFKPGSYELLKHNCNTFSAYFVRHLTGLEIPSYITSLPSDFLGTPVGSALRGILENAAMISDPSVSRFSHSNNLLRRRSMPSTVRPVLFDEPISPEFTSNELTTMFSGGSGLSLQWANTALSILRSLSSPKLVSEDIPLEALSLLKFNRWATFKQCEAICEVFRLAVWRCPELIVSLITDPNESLHKLSDAYPSPSGQISRSAYFDLDAAKSHLLCNVFSLSYDWDLTNLNFIPLGPVVALCNRLISCDATEDKPNRKPTPKSPEHEMAGLALTLNLALCPLLGEQEALEVSASLFHLVVTKKGFKHPTGACYVLKAIYVFIKSFPTLIDLAKTLGIAAHVPELSSQAEHAEDDLADNKSHVDAIASISAELMEKLTK